MTTTDAAAFTASTARWDRSGTLGDHDSLSGIEDASTLRWYGTASWLDSAERSIKQLLFLDTGWDGEYALPITETAVERSESLVAAIADALPTLNPPFISASIYGGVTLEWSRRGTAHVQFSVGPEGVVEVMAAVGDFEVEADAELDDDAVEQVFEALETHFTAG